MRAPHPRARLLASGAVLAATAVLASGCEVRVDTGGVRVRERHEFAVEGTPEVALTTFGGGIDVKAWDRPAVHVEVERVAATKEAADALLVEAVQEGRVVRVEARDPATSRWANAIHRATSHARIFATVPRACTLTLRTTDGSLSVERVTGTVKLVTGDGSVRAAEVAGDLDVDTGDGSVKLQDVSGTVKARSGDGSVWVAGTLETVDVLTRDGTISVRPAVESKMTSDWSLSTGDGSVVLYLPGSFGAELDAATGDGTVRVDRALRFGGPSRATRRAAGPLGEGGRVLRVRTNDGSIAVRSY